MLRTAVLGAAFLLFAGLLSACGSERADRRPEPAPPVATAPDPAAPVEPAPEGLGPEDPAYRLAALNDALHTYEQLVETLRSIVDPISAWNEGANAALLIEDLERNRDRYALALSPEQARREYPTQMRRLEELERAYRRELLRIQEDPVAWQVLLEEIIDAGD